MDSQEQESERSSVSSTEDELGNHRKEHGLYKNEGRLDEGGKTKSSNAIDAFFTTGLSTLNRDSTTVEQQTDHSTPFFISNADSPVSLDDAGHQWVHHVPHDRVEIRVPPVEHRWEYRTFDYDIRIASVLEELDDDGLVSYLVEKKDNRRDEFTFEQLVDLPGGRRALEKFQSESLLLQSSDSGDSDTIMVVTRRARPVARHDNLFVDSSKLELSGDEVKPRKGRPRASRARSRVPRIKSSRSDISQSAQSTDDSDSSEQRSRKRRRVKSVLRLTRSTANTRPTYKDRDLESSGSDNASTRRRKRKRRATDTGPARKSVRSGRAVNSMRELLEDDIPEVMTRGSSKAAPKISGAKEFFQPLPITDDFRLRHCQNCDVCNEQGDIPEKGKLVCCQGCTLSYHTSCLGNRNGREHLVTKIGHEDFVLQCRRCVEFVLKKDATAPHQSECQECGKPGPSCHPFRDRKTPREEQKEREENNGEDPITVVSSQLINNYRNVMFRCVSCYQAFHMHHLPSKSQNLMEPDDEDQKATERFSWYCQDWACDDCLGAPADIGGLVAWRPKDIESYVAGKTVDEVPEDEKEYLVKWNNKSYYRSTWKRGSWVWGMTNKSSRLAFARKENGAHLPKMRTEDAIPEDYLRVDIVLEIKYNNVVSTRIQEVDLARIKEVASARVKFKGLGYEDVVWEEPPAPEDAERWADFKAAYEDWVRGHYIRIPPTSTMSSTIRRTKALDFESKVVVKEQPKSLKGGDLMDYQIDGLNWLLYQWHQGHNAILADEMGLGKTIQVIAFVAMLQERYNCWPFLIVVPNSTCANWRREIKHWAPSLRVVTYFGSTKAKELALKYELFPDRDKPTDLRCHVVVTSYDAAQEEACQKVFKKIHWAALIVDEGQRLKNDKNLLYNALSAIRFPFKVLLTGTPLQNNQRELFNLLQFLDPTVNAQQLEEKYVELTKENVSELHSMLRPFFLRRTKAQVLSFLPPMAQIIVPVSMSALQKQLYKSILAKNSELLQSIFGGDRTTTVKGLRNILMQLRKCLCHPFVYSIAIEEKSAEALVSHRRLVEASSKLQLLEIMLPKLKERGHRVLIFSQFLDMMTIIEDFLDGLALEYLRLDGSMHSMAKQKCIDAFNAPDSSVFVLLLSTRAGGVGINLATADTVIILDPDFNPHQDVQAISRAHRIGQKKKVLIFQMMTRGSAEEKIMQIGKKKMALDHVLIEQMAVEDADGNDLESVLRFGAEALFNDDDTQNIHYDSASVDKLLDRSQIEDTQTGKDASAESQFSFAKVWLNDSATMEEGLAITEEDRDKDDTLWTKILAERARQARLMEETEALGRGKRQRRNVDYNNQAIADTHADDDLPNDENDTDFQARNESEDDDESAPEDAQPIDVAELKNQDASRRSRSKIIEPTPPAKIPKFTRADPPKVSRHVLEVATPLPKLENCLACNFTRGPHAIGYCPLKIVGVERCNLCGMAHYGYGRSCPHLNSETQVSLMLKDLKRSPEDKALVEKAKKLLSGIKGSLIQQKKKKEEAALANRALNLPNQSEQGQSNGSKSSHPIPPMGVFTDSRPSQGDDRRSLGTSQRQGTATGNKDGPGSMNTTWTPTHLPPRKIQNLQQPSAVHASQPLNPIQWPPPHSSSPYALATSAHNQVKSFGVEQNTNVNPLHQQQHHHYQSPSQRGGMSASQLQQYQLQYGGSSDRMSSFQPPQQQPQTKAVFYGLPAPNEVVRTKSRASNGGSASGGQRGSEGGGGAERQTRKETNVVVLSDGE